MSQDLDFDAIVIGGGPAGLFLALLLGRQGYRSAVVERGQWPRDKACGEGLLPLGVDILRRHNLLPQGLEITPEQHSFSGITFFNEDGTSCRADFSQIANESKLALGMRRTVLSARLHEAILGVGSVTLLDHTIFEDLHELTGAVTVSLRRGNTHLALRAKFVFGADGLRSLVAKRLGFERTPLTSKARLGVGRHFQIKPWSSKVEVWWSPVGEAYVTPVGAETLHIAMLYPFSYRAKDKERVFSSLLKNFPILEQRVAKATELGLELGYGPFGSHLNCSGTRRVFCLGDALCFTDGISGNGMTLALQQGEAISCRFKELLQSSEAALSRQAKGLEQELRRTIREHKWLTKSLLMLHRRPFLRRKLIHALSKQTKLSSRLLSLGIGRVI